MPEKNDFSWEKGKIKNGNSLGKIVSIPVEEDVDIPEDIKLGSENKADFVVDEFKEKMAEVLSRELHKKEEKI
ncbi:hypothetical protein [Methanolobus sp. WCC4]|uniref:hypothetical protein n=1 Tax=Methanolobus sp. WCC4 TaxID=3125784 RepID=UPI0030F6ED12